MGSSCVVLDSTCHPAGGTPSGPGDPYCYGNTNEGNPCPCNNDNDGTTPLGGCAHDDEAYPNGIRTTGGSKRA